MLNIVFSTTRQWNPGDEFILRGVRRILDSSDIIYNAIIYNRNPDIRSMHQDNQLFKKYKVTPDFWKTHEMRRLEANIKLDAFDNSVKPDSNLSFVDAVFLAGTPEWCNGRTNDLYQLIERYNLPLYILGVGGGYLPYKEEFIPHIRNAKLFTVRDEDTYQTLLDNDFSPTLLPCPALLSAPYEKNVEDVKTIGLIFQGTVDDTVLWNGCTNETYDYLTSTFNEIINKFHDKHHFKIICHYIDEVLIAKQLYPEYDILYSYNSDDYFGIYSSVDLVIGPRVHGIGAAASLGIPGIAISHDLRGVTCKGFLAEIITVGDDSAHVINLIQNVIENITRRSQDLIVHKYKTLEAYTKIISNIELKKRDDLIAEKTKNQTIHDLVSNANFEYLFQNNPLEKTSREIEFERKYEQQRKDGQVLADMYQSEIQSLDKMYQSEIQAIKNSRSWKVTSPLRTVSKILRKIITK